MIGDSRDRHSDHRVRTEWTFGPAFFGLIIQTAIAIIAFVFLYGQQVATNENTRRTTEKLEQILDRSINRTDHINDRLIKLETLTEGTNASVKSLDAKVTQQIQHMNRTQQ